ncbi:Penicillin-binding protein 1B [compost metagenome]
MAIAWVGRDNNGPAKLTGANGALTLYRRYLENQTPLPLMLQPPEDINQMGIDSAGNFVCGGGSWRTIPVWTDNPQGLCQTAAQQEPSEQKDANGVAGWIKDMFGQ